MARPVAEVADEIRGLGCSYVTNEQLVSLADQLGSDEHVLASLGADSYEQDRRTATLLVITPLRLITVFHIPKNFLSSFQGYGTWSRHVYWSDVATADVRLDGSQDWYLGVHGYTSTAGSVSVRLLSARRNGHPPLTASELRSFTSLVQDRVSRLKSSRQQLSGFTTTPATSRTDFIGELERLTALHQSGALSAEEFQLAKQKLLRD